MVSAAELSFSVGDSFSISDSAVGLFVCKFSRNVRFFPRGLPLPLGGRLSGAGGEGGTSGGDFLELNLF